jgi:hypothetical protein
MAKSGDNKILKRSLMKSIKNMHKLLLLLCAITLAMTASENKSLDPESTVIAADIDGCIIQPSYYQKINFVLNGIWKDPLNSYQWLQSLSNIKARRARQADEKKRALNANDAENENPISGVTFEFLNHACEDETLMPYLPLIIETIENSREYIEDTKTILQYLKEQKNYEVVGATNKDRVSYDIADKKLNLGNIIEKAFVSHPNNDNPALDRFKEVGSRENVAPEFKQLLNQVLNAQPSHKIHHVPSAKPHQDFDYMINTLGTEKNVIFIDDKKENIDGFNNTPNNSKAQRHGIHFTSAQTLADEFVKLGILSETDDKTLLDKIYKRK